MKIAIQGRWTALHGVFLEEQILRLDREERETTIEEARAVYALCRQALIDQRRPPEDV